MGVAKSKRRQKTSSPARRTRRRAASAAKTNGQPIHLKYTIASTYPKGHAVQTRILRQIHRYGYDSHSVFAIKLATDEALINAIKHGNKMNPAKKVHIEAKIAPRKTEITIEDEGPGFNRNTVPDPTAEENLCKCSGRGILLMEAYMNSVKWSKGGRRVKMVRMNPRYLGAKR